MKRIINKNLIFILMMVSLFLTSCSTYSQRMLEYYSDDNNYEIITGVIQNIDNLNGNLYLIIDFENEKNSYDGSFKIVADNEQILKDNNFYDEISIGNTITFTSAPRIFEDGYIVPIVSLSANDKIYLVYDEAKSNLLEWCRK